MARAAATFGSLDQVFGQRAAARLTSSTTPWLREGYTDAARRIARQAYAGLLWSKQFYHYSVEQWLEGDPAQPRLRQAANMAATTTGSISTIAT